MKKLLKLAAVAVALGMFVSAAAEAQGGGGAGRGGGGQGRGGGQMAGRIVADGVSADSAYNMIFATIPSAAAKKAALVALVTKLQTDLKANPAPARGARGGPPLDSATMLANQAMTTKRNGFITTFQTEVKKQIAPADTAAFTTAFPAPGQGRGRGGL